jgi:hypothetical protein
MDRRHLAGSERGQLRIMVSQIPIAGPGASAFRFLDNAKAKVLAFKIAPNGAYFRVKLAKRACFSAKIGGFSGFLFTDEYMGRFFKLFVLFHLH